MTDQLGSYRGLDQEFASHEVVNHSIGEYVRGDAHTNTAEGYFANLKRGINGSYHHVSQRHLHRYLSEFDSAGTLGMRAIAPARWLRCARPRASGSGTVKLVRDDQAGC